MVMNRRDRLKAIFEDTMIRINNTPYLKDASQRSTLQTKYYAPEEYPLYGIEQQTKGEITVTRHSTFEAAKKLHEAYPDKKIAVLNFASATNPGGGVVNGSNAQEECLCRCSTLYPTLTQKAMWDQYYSANRAEHNALHNDACIYSPGIVVFKSDDSFPVIMPEKDWFIVDVISCAAPNLRKVVSNQYNPESGKAVQIEPEELFDLHLKRAKHIMTIAAANCVDLLVLGAFGCGAFCNEPNVVSEALITAADEFAKCFDLIEFAVYCRPYETENYEAFLNARDRRISLD